MAQLGELQSSLGEFQRRGVFLAAISVDSLERSQSVAAHLGLGFPLLSDAEHVATRSFGVEDTENDIAWPAVFVLDRRGAVRWRSLSDDYRNRPKPEEILAVLDGLNQDSAADRPHY